MKKPRKPVPADTDPIAAYERWEAGLRYTPTREDRTRREQVLLEAMDRLATENPARAQAVYERHFPEVPDTVTADARALELGGPELAIKFRLLRGNRGVAEDDLLAALDYLAVQVPRVAQAQAEKRQRTRASDLVPRLMKWLREGERMLCPRVRPYVSPEGWEGWEVGPEEETLSALRPTVRRLGRVVLEELLQLYVRAVIRRKSDPRPNPIPRSNKPGPATLGLKDRKAETTIYRLFKRNLTRWEGREEHNKQKRLLRGDARDIVVLLGVHRPTRAPNAKKPKTKKPKTKKPKTKKPKTKKPSTKKPTR